MKKIYSLIFLFLFPWILAAQIRREVRTVIYPEKRTAPSASCTQLQPGQSISCPVNFKLTGVPAKRYLRVIGGAHFPPPFTQRGETMFRNSEYYIDDCLDSLVTHTDRYSLYFKGNGEDFERHAYCRIPGNSLKEGKISVTLPVVRRNSLKIEQGGMFGLKIGIYYTRNSRHADDIYDEPDSVWFIPIPEGSGKAKSIRRTFTLPDGVACLFLQLGGIRFRGECWVEAPRFSQHKHDVYPLPFTRFAERSDPNHYWVGCNLSTRSWPQWQLDYNGQPIFQKAVFDRASNVADFYIPLPDSLSAQGTLKLTLQKDLHRTSYPYDLRQLEIIEEPARAYEIISVPRYVTAQTPFGVLVETNRPNVRLNVHIDGEASTEQNVYTFRKTGLHVLPCHARKGGQSIRFRFSDGERETHASVSQVIEKDPDGIYVSSGDEIYIDKESVPYDYFFKWYFSNRVGNWYQFRPSYQWSGFRIARPDFVRHYTGLLNQMQVPYAWQVEGRTLAGSRINPTLNDLNTPMFRGKQAHENDGGYYYWQHFKYEGLFSDLAARNRPYGGIFAKHRPIHTDHGTFIHYDPKAVKDMADGARYFVENLKYSKGESTRHTGPSTAFRYFYQAGYDWLGAEQMYGPEETVLSSLRGASRAYGRTDFGSLHAMQWGSYPFTDPKHALRLYQSLAVAYMHGSSHLNTEEALWTDEYLNDRYSVAGQAHLHAQHQVLDFVETHTRRGTLKSPIAVIQGRNDAWKSFMRGNLWSQEGEKWNFNRACESFDLLKVFYPDNELDCCGPQGWFTSTPYGAVDLLPVEAPQEVMNRYQVLVFLGWNSYDAADFERLRQYVARGGTLLLTAAHLNASLQPDETPRFPENDEAVRQLLGENYRNMTGKNVIRLGQGKIVYFPQKAYPAEPSLRTAYEEEMRRMAGVVTLPEKEKGWVEAAPSVGFTAWDQDNCRTLYLLNTDWQSSEASRPATFVYGQRKFRIQVRRYHTETIHCAAGLAVMPLSNTTDVLDIRPTSKGWKVRFQTTAGDALQCMRKDTGIVTTLRTDRAGIFEKEVLR